MFCLPVLTDLVFFTLVVIAPPLYFLSQCERATFFSLFRVLFLSRYSIEFPLKFAFSIQPIIVCLSVLVFPGGKCPDVLVKLLFDARSLRGPRIFLVCFYFFFFFLPFLSGGPLIWNAFTKLEATTSSSGEEKAAGQHSSVVVVE